MARTSPIRAAAPRAQGDRSRPGPAGVRAIAASPLRLAQLAFALALAKHAPLNLARGGHRQGIDEFDLLRILVRRQELAHVELNVFLQRRSRPVPGGENDERL